MKYKCVFPNCTYETDNRSLIEYHHVYPRELRVTLNKNVTVPLCSCHHKLIYHPDATSGQHSVKHPDSMMIDGVYNTNTGKGIQFTDMYGKTYTTFMDDRKELESDIGILSWDMVHGIDESSTDSNEIEDNLIKVIDKYGYCVDGLKVYFKSGFRHIAADLLAMSITSMMTKVKSEYNQVLDKARTDWKTLKEMEN